MTRTTRRERNEEPPTDAEVLERTAVDAAVADVSEVIAGLGPQTRCHILRALQGGRVGNLGRVDLDALGDDPAEYLARTYGPGSYVLQFFGPRTAESPTGYIRGKRSQLTIDDAHPGVSEFLAKKRAPSANGGAPDGMSGRDAADAMGGAAVADLIRASADALRGARETGGGSGGNMEILTAMIAQQGAAADRTMQMFAQMMQSQNQMMSILLPLLAGGKSDPMQLATEMARLMKETTAPSSTVKDTIETLRMAKEFIGGGDADDDGERGGGVAGTLVRQALPILGRMVDAGLSQQQRDREALPAPDAVQVPVPSEVPRVATPSQSAAKADDGVNYEMIETVLRQTAASMLDAAKKKMNPERYGAMMYRDIEKLLPAWQEKVLQYLAETENESDPESPFTLEKRIATWVPESQSHTEWIERVLTELRICAGILDDADDELDVAPNESGGATPEKGTELKVTL